MALLCIKHINQCIINNCKKLSQIKQSLEVLERVPSYMELSNGFYKENEKLASDLIQDMVVYKDFLSVAEEKNILNEIEPYLKNLRYEFDHWDDAIHGYRETERSKWNEENTKTFERLQSLAFPSNAVLLKHVHVLDLDEKGYIKPHIDAVRFCGDVIAGLSLLSDSVMRLVHDKNSLLSASIFLNRRSLYIMKGTARYDYTHEILSNEVSKFKNKPVLRHRRISVICRSEPQSEEEL